MTEEQKTLSSDEKKKLDKEQTSMGVFIILLFIFFWIITSFLIGLILILVCGIVFVKMLKSKPTLKKFIPAGLIIIVALIIISIFAPAMKSDKEWRSERDGIVAVFNLEVLYGKNIDEIKAILGIPSSDTEPRDLQVNVQSEGQLAKEWDKTWEKNGYELSISYNVASREVIDFFVSTNDPSGATKNIKQLEEVVGVKTLTNFTVQPVKAMGSINEYTGIIIIPKK